MYFRPLPVLTVLTVLALGLLITLGVWQLDRMDEKAEAIARYEAGNSAPPISLESALCTEAGVAWGRQIIRPDLWTVSEVRYFGRDGDGRTGWRLFNIARMPACADRGPAPLLVETGFRTDAGEVTRNTGALILSPTPRGTLFDAPNDPESGDFYHFDPEDMENILGVHGLVSEFWLTAQSAGVPPELAQTPPSRHLGYALTWFGFALTLIGVYIAFHVSRKRLGFTRR